MKHSDGFAHQHPYLREIYEGKHDTISSVHDFLTHMPDYGSGKCHEFSREKNDPLRIFWYPSQTNVHDQNFASRNSILNLQSSTCELITRPNPQGPGNSTSTPALSTSVAGGKLQSVQERMMSFLLSLKYTGSDYVFVQFWTVNRTSSGSIMVSVSEQPFAMSKLYTGFCRYRYYCIHRAKCVQDISELGPLGRVVKQGSPEYCCDIDSYSIQDFPKRNYAKFCGIKDYLALPIFELGHGDQQGERQCIGVLEFLSWYSPILLYSDIMTSLQCSDFNLTSSHFQECTKVRENVLKPTLDVRLLDFVRTEHRLPLIHVWVPCICETSRVAQLYCQLSSIDREMIYLWDYQCLILSSGTHSVEAGKGLAGRAYSQKKSCFSMNASQFSISDYPLVHFTRLNGLNACFAILLESVHPILHPLILEVFLPPQQNYAGNVGDVLRSLLATLSEAFSMHNFAFALTEDVDFQVEFSHLDNDNVVYFDVCRSGRTVGNEREEHDFHSFQDHEFLADSVHEPSQTFDVISKGQEVEDREFHADATHEPSQTFDVMSKGQEVEDCEFHADAVHEPFQTFDVMSKGQEVEDHEYHADAIHEPFQTFDVMSKGQEAEEALENRLPSPKMLLRSSSKEKPATFEAIDHTSNVEEDEAEDASPEYIDEFEITLDVINRYHGCTKLAEAAEKLGVSRATLKRRCRKFGIKRWPYHKRKEGLHIRTSARQRKTKSVEDLKIVLNNNNNADLSSTNAKAGSDGVTNQKHSLIVKATYRDDTAKFPFCSNSCLENLQKQVQKRFKLEAEMFKIKYMDDDGEWIILSCNEDLHFHIQAVKASRQSSMKLSVFPVAF